MSDSQVSVGAALSYAWSLWRGHWREIWGALALNGLAWTVLCAGLFAQMDYLLLAGGVAQIVTTLVVYGAIVRLACGAEHPDDPGFRLGGLGIQFRRMELRVLGATLLLYLFICILALLLFAALVIPPITVMMTHGGKLPATMTQKQMEAMLGPDGMAALKIGLTLVQLILYLVWVRLSLAMATSAGSGRVSVLRTWKLARGHFLQLLFATMLIGLPTGLIMSLAGLPIDGQAAPFQPGEMFLYSLICGGWAGAAATPLLAGVQTYFYRKLSPPAELGQ